MAAKYGTLHEPLEGGRPHPLRVPKLDPGFCITPVPCVDDEQGELDVLLRHRLLLKLGGFQSIGWLVKEGLEAKQSVTAATASCRSSPSSSESDRANRLLTHATL